MSLATAGSLVRLAGALRDHDRVGEREPRSRVDGARAEQFLAMLVVQLGCLPSTRLYEPSNCRSQ